MPNEQDIYEEHVLDHYEDPYHRGTLESASHMHEGNNPLCGDRIVITLKLDDSGKVAEAWFEGEGCVISQASASMLIERMEGKTIEEVKAFTAEEMLELFGPKLTPNRQKCCLLSWKILQSALHSPIDEDGDSSAPGGPSLGEEQ
ncbi:MAG TPA: SUF system NifU family Fe-S cluster assembly protein [Rhodopirellula baltica]|uniref:Nitrogen fixation protein NifU n=2 Tax=Rhodopirellula baltica TaxID=265606 RepID=Q7UU01_RHOBA|nr:SUF system NifU family Fe-S cluster assembly protein [Rhodopirellula baltica]EKK04042.1 SUF system FeS assembly protein, NifU family [Rhodopirellula baltica SH28]CAD73283.1 nitrogen fixation protein NifU [Rhodopirellula baltica SH 1]HBE62948.1 SUF system NifU family Fe-S cluster assembly protein [Rhodopirellula baltica]